MNRYQGEAELKLGEDRWTLTVNWRVLMALEDATGMGFPALLEELKTKATIKLITQVIFQSLKVKHPEISFDDAGELVFGAGMGPAIAAWYECFNQAWGDLNEAEQPADPLPRALRSIGTA
jgi:hypothetical protein